MSHRIDCAGHPKFCEAGTRRVSELGKPTRGHLLDQDYLTSTGETVARPGVSQSSGTTPLDRWVGQQDNRIYNGICNGC